MANKFQKQFHIFKSMDNDVGNPSGYIKVEINGEQAKLQLSLNNLLNRQGFAYQLYGIKKTDSNISYTVICDIPNINGRADVKLNTDTNKVGANDMPIEQINIYAIILRLSGKMPALKCPLVAYAKEELDWKNEFDSHVLINERKQAKNNLNIENSDSFEKDANKLETNKNIEKSVIREESYADGFDKAINNEPQENFSKRIDEVNVIELFHDRSEKSEEIVGANKTADFDQLNNRTEEVVMYERSNVTKAAAVYDTTEPEISIYEDNNDSKSAENINNVFDNNNGRAKEDNKESVQYELNDTTHINNKEVGNEAKKSNLQANNQLLNDMKLNFSGKFESVITSIYNTDKSATLTSIYNNATAKKEPELNLDDNDILGSVEENFKDISSIEMDKVKGRTELNLPELKDELNKSFESYNPFRMKSKNFNWWKINSPGYLNNILFRNNIRTYLLFNPKVMLAHYKYRYIIFGIRLDRRSGKEHFICGIPGVYSIDENPFGSMGSWAQTEGYKPKYGAFGYWLIMIDPKTGKLIKIR